MMRAPGARTVAPVDRHAVIPVVIIWIAFEAGQGRCATLFHHSVRLP